MLAPVFGAFKWRKLDAYVEYSPHLGTISLLLTLNALDMIPNDTMTMITLLLSGAAWGHLEYLTKRARLGQLTELKPSQLRTRAPILANHPIGEKSHPVSGKKTII